MTTPTDTMPDDKSRELLELLDGMAETWCERFGIAEAVRSIPVNYPTKEFEDRTYALIIRHIKQAYAEGVYCGRISHVDLAAAREAALMAVIRHMNTVLSAIRQSKRIVDMAAEDDITIGVINMVLDKHAAVITEAQAQTKGGKDGQ